MSYRNISALNSAIWANDVKRLLEILQNEPSEILSKPNKEGWIPLHEAAHYGSEECLRVLIRGMNERQSFCFCDGTCNSVSGILFALYICD